MKKHHAFHKDPAPIVTPAWIWREKTFTTSKEPYWVVPILVALRRRPAFPTAGPRARWKNAALIRIAASLIGDRHERLYF